MSHIEIPETCHFGHVIEPVKGSLDHEVKKKIETGEIDDLDQLKEETGMGLMGISGAPYKNVKVSASSQGFPRTAAFLAADKLDDDVNYETYKVKEGIYVSPQSNLHGEYMQRKQNAEQNIKNTMQNISQLTKQKHMLEHDIRKLRTRAEDLRSGEETEIKGDFIELVDGAGSAGQQGGDEASLKFYRDNNIYPSIVADFNEMDSLDDLEEDGKLADLPNNEKAILRKKYAMYEKWKDLYGSEIQRKLKELKRQLKSIEKSIQETKEWLEPYVRDMVMINETDQAELADEINSYFMFKGTSSQFRKLEFIAYRPMKNDGERLSVIEDNNEEEATHYRVIHVFAAHVNLAGFDQPQTPKEGPSAAKIFWRPVIVCRHVFENFYKKRINKQADQFENLIEEYHGNLNTKEGDKIREAREDEDLTVRQLREKIEEDTGEDIPIEFSSNIRRIEDGIDTPDVIEGEYEKGGKILESMEEILGLDLKSNDSGPDEDMYNGITRKLREFTGQVDAFKIPNGADPKGEFKEHFKFDFYYDYKIDLGLYTMK